MGRTETVLQRCRHLTELYSGSAEDMIVLPDPDRPGHRILLPTVYFPIYRKTLEIEDDPKCVYHLPPVLAEHFDELIRFHQKSSVYNNTNIRVNAWQTKGDRFLIQTGRTTYFDTLATNRGMDYEFGNGRSVRALFEPGPVISPLDSSCLSNHLGINGFIESKDHYFCFVFRKQSVSFGKQVWSCGISGSLKEKYSLEDGIVTGNSLINGIVSEVLDELNLPSASVLSSCSGQPIILAYAYRDLAEGGKPHLFFYGQSTLSKDKMDRSFRQSQRLLPDDSRSDLSVEMSMDGKLLLWVSRDVLTDPERFQLFPDRFSVEGTYFVTDPSYASCFQLLRLFLTEHQLS